MMTTMMMTTIFIIFSLNTISSLSTVTHNVNPPSQSFSDPLLQNLRLLLGLRSFRPASSNGHHHYLSPSPSPSPSPSHLHVERKPRPERHFFHPLPKPRREDEKGKRVLLIALLVPIGGLIVMTGVAILILARKKSNRVSSRKSANRVSLNPGLDLFYLDSLGSDLEKQQAPTCLKQTPHYAEESADINDELTSSSGHELVPVKDDDDQSFHSLVESNSSNAVRLSNASLGSFSDALENFNSAELNPNNQSDFATPIHENDVKRLSTPFPHPPPPPPPPPPPRMSFLLPSRLSASSYSSTRNDSIASTSSSTLPSPSPPKEQTKALQLNEHFASSPLVKNSAGTIPPPPCPPPLFKTPPPSQLHRISPTGKDGTPLPKLKPLHWDKLRAAPNQPMVWDKLRSSSFELDEEMIESLFGYNLQQNSMRSDEAKSKTPSPSKHVLEPKRLQNITILSKALNVSSEQVCEAMLQGKGLSLRQLEALVKMAPTEEEEGKLFGYRGDVNELGSAEKFLRAMLAVPFAFQRLQAMLFAESFDDEVLHLKNSFSMLEEACKELRSSRLFLKLLEAVLKTGNRMNVGTIRGGARAFKLDALLKLADVKGTDGRTSLLHFVVQEIARSEGMRASDSIMGRIEQRNRTPTPTPDEREDDYRRMGLDLVSGLTTELYNVKRTAAIDLDVLVTSVSNLSQGLAHLRGLVLTCGTEKGFSASMGSFLSRADKRLGEIKGDEDGVMSRVREIAEYFHGNVGKQEPNPLRIFVIVRDFLGMLDNVCKELRSSSKTSRSPNPLAPFR